MAQQKTGKPPYRLDFDDLDAQLIGAFLTHLEQDRGNSPRTRNAGLGAIHSLYWFAALRHPEHAQTIARVMAIPTKRYQRNVLSYLDLDEINALLAAPGRAAWLGRRDRALLLTAIKTGLRVSELTALRVADASLGRGAHVRVIGKTSGLPGAIRAVRLHSVRNVKAIACLNPMTWHRRRMRRGTERRRRSRSPIIRFISSVAAARAGGRLGVDHRVIRQAAP